MLTVVCLSIVAKAEIVTSGVYFYSAYNYPNFYQAFVQYLNVTSEIEVLQIDDLYGSGVANGNVAEVVFSFSYTPFVITQFFTTFPNVKSLQMTQGKLERIQPGAFRTAFNLEVLDYRNNLLRYIGPNSFYGAEKMIKIGLWSNLIEGIDANAFNGLLNLQELILNGNKLRTLPATLFSPLPKLKFIAIRENELLSIPSKLFSRNWMLETVALGNNMINAISPDLLKNLPVLNILNLHNNVCIGIKDGKNLEFSYTDFQVHERVQILLDDLQPCFRNFVEVPEHCPAI